MGIITAILKLKAMTIEIANQGGLTQLVHGKNKGMY
jgi:hypothetical protein